MQLGLVLDGFTRNEMLFDVAQGGSLRRATTTGQEVVRRGHNPDSFRTMINRKARISASDYGSANGNRTRILALKGTTHCIGRALKIDGIQKYLHCRIDKLHCSWETKVSEISWTMQSNSKR